MATQQFKKLDKAPSFRWYALLMNALAYGYFFMTVNILNAMTDEVQQAFGVSATELTFLTTAVMIAFAVVPTFGAHIAAKIGGRNIVALSIFYNVVVTLLFLIPAVSQDYLAVLVLRFLHGATGGLMTGTVVGGTPLWFPVKERGIASGLNLGILGVGFSIDTFFAPRLMGAGLDWFATLVVILVVPGVLLGAVYFFTMKDIKKLYGVDAVADALDEEQDLAGAADSKLHLPATMGEAYRDKVFWATGFYGFVNGWVVYGFTAFLPSMLTNDMGISGIAATNIISATYFVTFVASPLGGIISDKVFKGKRYQLLSLGCLLTVVTLLLIPRCGTSTTLLTVLFILAYGSTSIVCGTFWTLPSEIVKPDIAVKSSASVMTLANIGGVIASPILVAVTQATGSNMMSSYICIILALLAGIMALMIKR